MPFVVGFFIALAVGLTGVGAGSITAPILILFFAISPSESVGTALIFGAIIKLVVAPMYLARKQVNRRVMTLLCAGGLPGVLLGVYLISVLNTRHYERVLFVLLGTTIAATALYSVYRTMHKGRAANGIDRHGWLPLIAAGIGTEVGFSSAGAGALGSLALLKTSKSKNSRIPVANIFKNCLSDGGRRFKKTRGNPRKIVSPAKAPRRIIVPVGMVKSFHICFVINNIRAP